MSADQHWAMMLHDGGQLTIDMHDRMPKYCWARLLYKSKDNRWNESWHEFNNREEMEIAINDLFDELKEQSK